MVAFRMIQDLLKRYFWVGIGLIVAAYGAMAVATALAGWRDRPGWEPYQIATVLAGGHGYSFEGRHRWLYLHRPVGEYFPTAWNDPLYTWRLAGLLAVFGEHGRLIALLGSIGCVLATACLVAATARRLGGPVAGGLAVILLLASVAGKSIALDATMLAGLWVALLLLYFVRHMHEPTVRRGITLGVILD